MNYRPGIPRYLQIADAIRRDLRGDGERIDSEHSLCARFKVSRPTVRQALDRYLTSRRDVLGGSRLFVSGAGCPLPYNSVRYVFLTLLDRAGLRGAHAGRDPRIHDLRHTFAVRRSRRGIAAGSTLIAR